MLNPHKTQPDDTHLFNSGFFYIPDSQEELHLEQLRFQFKSLLRELTQAQVGDFQSTLAKLPDTFKLGSPSKATPWEIPFSFHGLRGHLNPCREYHHYLGSKLRFYTEEQDLPVASLLGISCQGESCAIAQLKYNPAGLEDPDTLEV